MDYFNKKELELQTFRYGKYSKKPDKKHSI